MTLYVNHKKTFCILNRSAVCTAQLEFLQITNMVVLVAPIAVSSDAIACKCSSFRILSQKLRFILWPRITTVVFSSLVLRVHTNTYKHTWNRLLRACSKCLSTKNHVIQIFTHDFWSKHEIIFII